MSFRDILKNSFLENYTFTTITPLEYILVMIQAALVGLFVALIYKYITRNSFFQKTFFMSLVTLSMITASIILTIQISVVVSLGMVGALSIVRFRTAIKDPMDLMFLFWSIGVGIITGAGIFWGALILSVSVSTVMVLMQIIPEITHSMILVINVNSVDKSFEITQLIDSVLSSHAKSIVKKNHAITNNGETIIYELRTKDSALLINKLNSITGVERVTIMDHNGDSMF